MEMEASLPGPCDETAYGSGRPLRLMLDVSDLVSHLGDHRTLSGIQRVQSCLVLALRDYLPPAGQTILYVSFDRRTGQWEKLSPDLVEAVLLDLLGSGPRLVAGHDVLAGAEPLDAVAELGAGVPSVFCLLGAAWVQRDYFARITALQRRFGMRIVVVLHDLIPIFAAEHCDPGTTRAFEDFLCRAVRHTDRFLTVSAHTARDLTRYAASLSLPPPAMSVIGNGSSFDEFFPPQATAGPRPIPGVPDRFVLFVATIEGRKNHILMLDIWRRMLAAGVDVPHLVCVGRMGWRVTPFIVGLVETEYLDGRIILLEDVADDVLLQMYAKCLFTVYPSFYEGWGLPVGESLAAGKICVHSGLTALAEVAQGYGTLIDVTDPDAAATLIGGLIADEAARTRQEASIREGYQRIAWADVAGRVLAACADTAFAPWPDPRPYTPVPYGVEIGFQQIREGDGAMSGAALLAHLAASRAGRLLPRPLTRAALLTGESIRDAGTWGEPEQWGTWLCRGAGDIVFAVAPNNDASCIVALRLIANGAACHAPVRLTGNEALVWAGTIGDTPRTLLLSLPRPPAAREGWWRIRIALEIAAPPDGFAAIAALDARVPLVGFERLLVVPEGDLATRVELLTALLPSAHLSSAP